MNTHTMTTRPRDRGTEASAGNVAATMARSAACAGLAITAALAVGLAPAGASPLAACGPQQIQVGANSGTVRVACVDLNSTNTGIQNRNANNGTNRGATRTAGTGNNTASGNQVQGSGNVVAGGGNTIQANSATNVNGSGNTVTNVTGIGNSVNSNNTRVTNVTQIQNTTRIVDAPPSQPTIVYVPAPAPAPAPDVKTVVVTTDLGLSIDRGLGAEYAAGDALGIGWGVSRPMQVEIAFVRPEGRLVVYTARVEGPGNLITAIPGGVKGVMLLDMKGTADDGTTASDMVWFTIK